MAFPHDIKLEIFADIIIGINSNKLFPDVQCHESLNPGVQEAIESLFQILPDLDLDAFKETS